MYVYEGEKENKIEKGNLSHRKFQNQYLLLTRVERIQFDVGCLKKGLNEEERVEKRQD